MKISLQDSVKRMKSQAMDGEKTFAKQWDTVVTMVNPMAKIWNT